MDRVTIPNINLNFSVLGLGLWGLSGPHSANGIQLGWPAVSPDIAAKIIREAVSVGITYFDTSDFYGGGRGEMLLGALAGELPQDTVISTKGGLNRSEFANSGQVPRTFTPDYIASAIEKSLVRLKREIIDIYFLHGVTHEALRDFKLWDVLNRQKADGRIRYLGVSLRRSGLADDVYLDLVNHNPSIDIVQAPTNPTHFEFINKLKGKASFSKPIIGRSPYEHGFLLKDRLAEACFSSDDHRSGLVAENKFSITREIAAKIADVAENICCSRQGILMQFAQNIASSGVCIVGARKEGQITESAIAMKPTIDRKILDGLVRI